MRASDQVLHDDLLAAGLPQLAARAALGEWNDYFGTHDLPQMDLLEELRGASKTYAADLASVNQVISRLIDGRYDGTKAESEEWQASPEGVGTFQMIRDGLSGGR